MKFRLYYDLDEYWEYDNFKSFAKDNKRGLYIFWTDNGFIFKFPIEIINKVIIYD